MFRQHERLGPYRLVTLIGAGGMGEVWRAEDSRLERVIALKILPSQNALDPEWKERFLREARMAARVNHPNIATIYAVGEESGVIFLAMEYVDGTPLSSLVGTNSVTIPVASGIVRDVALALHEAHLAGVIHRDVKPDNIMVTRRGPKLLDFGIARPADARSVGLTAANVILGTPQYMSPEQALATGVDARSDIFSLGVVLYELLTGRSPFQASSVTATLMQVITAPHLALENVPQPLAAIVDRCLAKRAEDRFRSMAELADSLTDWAGAARVRDPQQHVATAPIEIVPQNDGSARDVRPSADASGGRSFAVEPEDVREAPPPSSGRVLIIDDDAAQRAMIRAVASDLGFQSTEASDGAEGIRMLRGEAYDVVFLDLYMPRMDGWSVLDFLRTRPQHRSRFLIVVTSARDLKLGAGEQELVSRTLSKPVTVSGLTAALREVTGIRATS